MKIALCIGNLASKGRQGPNAYKDGYYHLKKNIIDKYDNVDVFLHSYETNLKSELINLYKPIDSVFEDQPNFYEEYKNLNKIYCSYPSQQTISYQNLFSMAYSRYIVGKLKTKFEKENHFFYDWVIFCRYDISSANHIEIIKFDPYLDNYFIYTPMFSQLNAGPQDQWFYSNSKNMDLIFSLYNNISSYFSENSQYVISATQNWIDSNITNRNSCEILLNTELKSVDGEKIPIGALSNGHLLYKWHLYVNNLWDLKKIKFIMCSDKYDIDQKILNHNNVLNIKN